MATTTLTPAEIQTLNDAARILARVGAAKSWYEVQVSVEPSFGLLSLRAWREGAAEDEPCAYSNARVPDLAKALADATEKG